MSTTETEYLPSKVEQLDYERTVRLLHSDLNDDQVDAEVEQWRSNEILRRRNAAEAQAAAAEARKDTEACQVCHQAKGRHRLIHVTPQEPYNVFSTNLVAGEGLKVKCCHGCSLAIAAVYEKRMAEQEVNGRSRLALAEQFLDNLEGKR